MRTQASAAGAGLCAAFRLWVFYHGRDGKRPWAAPAVDQHLGRPQPVREVNYVYARKSADRRQQHRGQRPKKQSAEGAGRNRVGFRELGHGEPPAGRKEEQPGRRFEQRTIDHEPHTNGCPTGGSRRQSRCGPPPEKDGQRMSRRPGGTSRSVAGTDARDGTITAERRGRTKAGRWKALAGPRSEDPFNEEWQFGEAKLPVFEMERESVATGGAGRGPSGDLFGEETNGKTVE